MTWRAILLALLLVLPAAPARAEEQPQQQSDGWKLMLQRNYEELQYQIDYVDGVSQTLPGMVKQTRQDLASLRKKLDELMVLARVSGSSPTELRAVLAGLEILRGHVEAVTQPFAKADTDLRHFQERLTEVEGEFSRQADSGHTQEVNKAMGDFLGDLRKLKGKLGRVKTVLDQGLSPTKDLQGSIGKLSQTITERIPRAWKDYYLTQGKGFLSAGAWQEAAQRITDLPKLLGTYLALFDSGGGSLRDLLIRLTGLFAVLFAASAVALKRLEKALPGFRVTRPLAGLAWVGLGAAVMWATSGPAYVLVRAETSTLAEIFLARGVLGLSWFLRGVASGQAQDAGMRANPVAGAWWLFAAAGFLQVPWLPEALRGAVWVLTLFIAGWVIRSRPAPGEEGGVVARIARMGGWFYPLLCLPALLGWVNMTLLAVMAWFLMLVFLQAGLALYGLVARVVERPAPDLTAEALRCLAGSLALPLTVLAMAAAFLFWLSMAMGGRSVFLSLVGADLGEEGLRLDLTGVAALYIGFHLARGASRVAARLITELPARRPDLERGIVNLLETVSAYVIWGVYALFCLRLVGASFTSLAVVAGGLSVGIGFGMQNVINNFISGLILLFGRSVQAGDVLQIGDIWGVVQRVNIRNTIVQTFDNATLFVPNSDLIAQKIVNWSHKDRRVRRTLTVGVAYGSDIRQVTELLTQAATSHPHVLADPKPGVQFTAFGEATLNFKLLFWVDDLDNAGKTSSDVHLAVERLFRENGVEIPYVKR